MGWLWRTIHHLPVNWGRGSSFLGDRSPVFFLAEIYFSIVFAFWSEWYRFFLGSLHQLHMFQHKSTWSVFCRHEHKAQKSSTAAWLCEMRQVMCVHLDIWLPQSQSGWGCRMLFRLTWRAAVMVEAAEMLNSGLLLESDLKSWLADRVEWARSEPTGVYENVTEWN